MTQIQLQGEQDTETHFFLLIPHLTRKRTPQGDVAGSIYDTAAQVRDGPQCSLGKHLTGFGVKEGQATRGQRLASQPPGGEQLPC